MTVPFSDALNQFPLVAILRGIRPDEVIDIADALRAAQFRIIEVPLNSPRPFESIARLRGHCDESCLVGAGTVMSTADVAAVRESGGQLIIMPHGDEAVIQAAKRAGLACIPGAQTPSEVFRCFAAGADAVKLFPAEAITPNIVKAMRAVVPAEHNLLPVGGINPDNMIDYWRAGASGFGLGSALYSAGDDAATVAQKAAAFATALKTFI